MLQPVSKDLSVMFYFHPIEGVVLKTTEKLNEEEERNQNQNE